MEAPLQTPKVGPVAAYSFDEGTGDAKADLDAVVDGLEFARRLSKPLHACGMIAAELSVRGGLCTGVPPSPS